MVSPQSYGSMTSPLPVHHILRFTTVLIKVLGDVAVPTVDIVDRRLFYAFPGGTYHPETTVARAGPAGHYFSSPGG